MNNFSLMLLVSDEFLLKLVKAPEMVNTVKRPVYKHDVLVFQSVTTLSQFHLCNN